MRSLFSGLEKHFSKTDADLVFTFGEEISPKEICKTFKETKADERLKAVRGELWHFSRRKVKHKQTKTLDSTSAV